MILQIVWPVMLLFTRKPWCLFDNCKACVSQFLTYKIYVHNVIFRGNNKLCNKHKNTECFIDDPENMLWCSGWEIMLFDNICNNTNTSTLLVNTEKCLCLSCLCILSFSGNYKIIIPCLPYIPFFNINSIFDSRTNLKQLLVLAKYSITCRKELLVMNH